MEFLATREPMVADPFSGQLRRSTCPLLLRPCSGSLSGVRPFPFPITLPLTVIDLASNGKNDGTIHTSYEAFSDTQVPSCSFQSQGWCVKPRQAFVRCGLDRPKLYIIHWERGKDFVCTNAFTPPIYASLSGCRIYVTLGKHLLFHETEPAHAE